MSKVLQETDKYRAVEHEPGKIYELVDKSRSGFGILFTDEDAVKFREMLGDLNYLTEGPSKKMRRIYETARRNIDHGRPKL